MHLSPFYLQIDYLYAPLPVGYQLFESALQEVSIKGNGANNRGEKLRKQAAAFPSASSTQTTAKQEVIKRQSQLCGHTLVCAQRPVWGPERKNGRKKGDTP